MLCGLVEGNTKLLRCYRGWEVVWLAASDASALAIT
jgi:hypothetical protein